MMCRVGSLEVTVFSKHQDMNPQNIGKPVSIRTVKENINPLKKHDKQRHHLHQRHFTPHEITFQ